MQFSLDDIRRACEVMQVPPSHVESINTALIYMAGYHAGRAGAAIEVPPPARKKPGPKPNQTRTPRTPKEVKAPPRLNPAAPLIAPLPAADSSPPVPKWSASHHTMNGANKGVTP